MRPDHPARSPHDLRPLHRGRSLPVLACALTLSAWGALCGGCGGGEPQAPQVSREGLLLAKALQQLGLDDLDAAAAAVDAARAAQPDYAALAPFDARVARERVARDTMREVELRRGQGDPRAAFALLGEIPRGTLAFDRAYDRHADLPRLIALAEALEARIPPANVPKVMGRVTQKLKGFEHQVRVLGPRRSPAVVVAPGLLLVGSCSAHVPCKSVAHHRGEPDPMAAFQDGELQQSTVSQRHHFFIDLTEVTAADLRACVDGGACSPRQSFADDPRCNLNAPGRGAHPANCVTAAEAAAYCAWASGRLPTELEWEAAARGPDGRRFPWGDTAPTCPNTFSQAAVPDCDPAPDATTSIGTFPDGASPLGLLDAAGNVAEWTASPFFSATPSQPRASDARAVRGGDFTRQTPDTRAAARRPVLPDAASPEVGFRCAYDL